MGEPSPSSSSSSSHLLLSELLSYEVFLLDQFGVLHDGVVPFPRARDLCRTLAVDHGKTLVILSNSSRRSHLTFSRLEKMGFDPKWFAGCVTSGDVAHLVLNAQREGQEEEQELLKDTYEDERYEGLWKDVKLPSGPSSSSPSSSSWKEEDVLRCLHLTWSSRGVDQDGFKASQSEDLVGMPRVKVCSSPEDANCILIHGTEAITTLSKAEGGDEDDDEEEVGKESIMEVVPLEEDAIEALLSVCADRTLPMLVANPDLVTVSGNNLVKMPGSLARRYKEMGVPEEKIHLLGKPSDVIYEVARKLFFPSVRKEGVVAVGDSLEHDILGAEQFGIDSVFITSGIHGDDLHKKGEDGVLCEQAMHNLLEKHGVNPTMHSKHFE